MTRTFACLQENSVLVLEAGSPKFNDRNIKMPIGILRYYSVVFRSCSMINEGSMGIPPDADCFIF